MAEYKKPDKIEAVHPAIMQDVEEKEPPKDGMTFLAYCVGQGYDIVYWHKRKQEFCKRGGEKHNIPIHLWVRLG